MLHLATQSVPASISVPRTCTAPTVPQQTATCGVLAMAGPRASTKATAWTAVAPQVLTPDLPVRLTN